MKYVDKGDAMKRLIVLVAVFLGACSGIPGMGCDAVGFRKTVQPIFQEWADANQIASSTSRIALPTQIASLQAIRRKAQDIQAPSCAATAKTELISAMDSSINGYLAFMSQESESTVNGHFRESASHLDTFTRLLSALDNPAAAVVATNIVATDVAIARINAPTARPTPTAEPTMVLSDMIDQATTIRDTYLAQGWTTGELNSPDKNSILLKGPEGARITISGGVVNPREIMLEHPYHGTDEDIQVFADFAVLTVADGSRVEATRKWVLEGKDVSAGRRTFVSGFAMDLRFNLGRETGTLVVSNVK